MLKVLRVGKSCCLALFLVAAAWAAADEPGQAAPSAKRNDDSALQTLRVEVEVVNVFFNVKDKRGALVPNLTRDRFEVFEEGAPQTIKYFAAESDQPLTLGLLMDTSGSVRSILDAEKRVGMAFLNEVIGSKDLAFLVTFDVNVDLLQDFTNSKSRLRQGFEKARINTGGGDGVIIPGGGGNPVPTSKPRGGTKLFDAVYLASREKLASEVGRKAIIILTDGQDEGSFYDIKQAIEAAQKADTLCYVLLIVDRGFYGGYPYSGPGDMEKLAEQTGGRMIEIKKMEQLKEAFDQIAQELRSQYSIGYTPSNTTRDGGFRRIQIKSTDGYKIQARQGYYATKASN
ncbi:MAG TPA: VWA domain-containing protein [Terriglobales bacterium]|nr:VWA domain-containing protein [Terriglobales bacterium]